MRRFHLVVLLLLIVFIISSFVWTAPAGPVKVYTRKIAFNKTSRTVNVVDVNLKDKSIKVEAGVANDKPMTVEPLLNFVKRKKAIAAINANFFAAYTDFTPVGAIAHNGEWVWQTHYGTSVGFSKDNEVFFLTNDNAGHGRIYINQVEQKDYIWYFDRQDMNKNTIIFTDNTGKPLKLNKGVLVVVKDDVVQEVKYAPADIIVPDKGFVLCFNMDANDALKRLISAKYRVGWNIMFEYDQDCYGFIDEKKYGEIVTAGPRLMVDGAVQVDPANEGFSEKKIVEYRAQRSALGLTKDNRLLMVTVSNVTIYELADIIKQLGAYQAMNLDGGASSGLYANGRVITAPGRKLSTFLTINTR